MVAYKLRGKIYHAYWREGKRKIWKSLKTSEERIARKKTVDLEEELEQRKKGFYGELPWKSFCIEYLEWSKTNKVEMSWAKDKNTIAHFNRLFRPQTVKDLNVKMLEDYKSIRKREQWRGAQTKESTINRELNTLKAMSVKAREWGYIREDPWEQVKKFVPHRSSPESLAGKEDAIRRICDDAYDRVLCDLAFYQGLRRGEMVNLKWEDVSEDKIRVVSTMSRRNKAKRERWIPIHHKTKHDLNELRKARGTKEEYVLGRNGEQTGGTYLSRRFAKLLKWAGEKGHLHLGRHTFGTKAARVGDLKTIMELLGHSRLSTTEIYVHSSEEAKKSVIDAL